MKEFSSQNKLSQLKFEQYLYLEKLKQFGIIVDNVSKEFSGLTDYQDDVDEYDIQIANWIFSELSYIRQLDEFCNNIKSKIEVFVDLNHDIALYDLLLQPEIILKVDFLSDWDLNDFFRKVSNESNKRLNELYNVKLPNFKLNTTSINAQIINNRERKRIFKEHLSLFEEFVDYIKELDSNNRKIADYKPNDLEWNPFGNDDVRDFYFLLEKKNGPNSNTMFSNYFHFLENNGLVEKKNSKQFIQWINARFNFSEKDKIKKLQPNWTENYLILWKDDLPEYEKIKERNKNNRSVSIPDANFQLYLIKELSVAVKDSKVLYQDIKEIEEIKCPGRGIESLEGIQHFTYLTSLNCSKNKLEHLDVSKNKALKYLNCSSNNLVELDLSHNMLERCNCSNNNSNGKVMTLNKLKRASMKAFIKIDKRFMLQ
jgi:hypothetical protein